MHVALHPNLLYLNAFLHHPGAYQRPPFAKPMDKSIRNVDRGEGEQSTGAAIFVKLNWFLRESGVMGGRMA